MLNPAHLMVYKLSVPSSIQSTNIKITGSKSISNRLLILQKLFDDQINIRNLSESDDTIFLKQCLNSTDTTLNVGLAGTSMRFMLSYLALKSKETKILTGLPALKKRPIKILVDALKKLGASIDYVEFEGYPPMKITATPMNKTAELNIDANVSSQYISSLMLIAPKLENGLTINLSNSPTSRPYLDMTISILNELGVKTSWKENCIKVFPQNKLINKTIEVEPDWSGASYYYSLVSLSDNATITLDNLRKDGLQGDREVHKIYQKLGVSTIFTKDGITLSKKSNFKFPKKLELNLVNTPDLAQTITLTCLGLGISCNITGLHTLKIKETDRLEALKTEIEKFGASIAINNESLTLKCSSNLKNNITINTYHDHRMAMAFAPLAIKTNLNIKDPEVVNKSYPSFWDDLKKTGILVQNIP